MTFARAGATLACVSAATCHYFFFTSARGAAVILRNVLVIAERGEKKKKEPLAEIDYPGIFNINVRGGIEGN